MTNITNSDTFKQGVKPVVIPSAQFAGKWQDNKELIQMNSIFNTYIDLHKESPLVHHAFTCLIIDTGIRVSEALNIKVSDIMANSTILIRGLKGSSNRIISIRYNCMYWNKFITKKTAAVDNFSRWFYYRYFKKKGLAFRVGDNVNLSVTHSARHLKVLNLIECNVDQETRAHELGHNNVKSQVYYEQKIK